MGISFGNFLKKYRFEILFKIIALIAIVFFYLVYNNNFGICPQVESIMCKDEISLPEGTKIIPMEYKCESVEDKECCIYIYDNNPQCYHIMLRQSLNAGFTGAALMLFAEVFYLIALIIYSLFPFLTRYVVYRGYSLNKPHEAAMISAGVFAKAIYFITPILLILIIMALFRNLPGLI